MILGQFGKIEINLDLIYDRADDLVRSALFRIIRRSYEVHALLTQELLSYINLLLVIRIIDSYRMTAEHLDNLHARNVGLPIAHIYHMRERNPLIVLCLTFVHLLVVPYAENSLIDLEQELGLGGIIDCNSRPLGFSLLIIYEGACKYTLEFLGNFGSLYHFRKTG